MQSLSEIAPKVEDAAAFLRDLRPNGPWTLSFIHADMDEHKPAKGAKVNWHHHDVRGFAWSHTFSNLDLAIHECNRLNKEQWRIYVQTQELNSVFNAFIISGSKKDGPAKANVGHVAAIPGVWLDVDAREGETVEQAKARGLELADRSVIKPRAVVDSGNGIQIHWRFPEPLDVTLEKNAVMAKGILVAICDQAKGDSSVAQLAALMRLPGFVNWPNATKRAKGREPVLAHLARPLSDVVTPADKFPVAEPRKPGRPSKKQEEVASSGPVDLDTLGISDELRETIRTGEFSEAQKQRRQAKGILTHTRSQVALSVATRAIREGVPLPVLKSLYEDERFGFGNGRTEPFENLIAAVKTDAVKDGIDNKEPDMKRLAAQIEKALAAAQVLIFRRDTDLVRIVKDKQAVTVDGVTFEAGTSRLLVNDWDNLRAEASHVATFFELDRYGEPKIVQPSLDALKTLKGTLHERSFPVLEGISHVPSLACDRPGYDAATRRYYDFAISDFMKCPAYCSWEDAIIAADFLLEHTRDMPFKDDASRSVYLAALLTAANRSMFRTAPLFGISANQPGLAKSKLSVCLGYLAMGREIYNAHYHGRKEEDSKQYLSMLRAGRSFICWDNVEDGLLFNNDQVNTGLQSAWIEGRILGESRQGTFSTCAMHVVNGNNLRFTKDITRRALMVSLYTEDPKWTEKHFDFDPVAMVKENWPKMVVATHVILRAFQQSGVRYTTGKAFGGFEDWSNLVRGAVRWLHMDDPLDTNESVKREDPDKETLATLLVTVAADRRGNSEWWLPKHLGGIAQDVLGKLTKSGTYSDVGVGKLVSRYVGRTHHGIKIEATFDPLWNRNKYRVAGTPTPELEAEIASVRETF